MIWIKSDGFIVAWCVRKEERFNKRHNTYALYPKPIGDCVCVVKTRKESDYENKDGIMNVIKSRS